MREPHTWMYTVIITKDVQRGFLGWIVNKTISIMNGVVMEAKGET